MYHKNSSNGRKAQVGIPVYSGGHVVGNVVGNVFKKSVSSSKHFLQKPPAIAFGMDSLNAAKAAGAERVEVYDKDTRTTYKASMAHLLENGFSFNRGWGEQWALPLDGWVKQTRGKPSQPALFGVGV